MKLYLIPCNLSNGNLDTVLPKYVLEDIIPNIKVFMVENLRTTRRFLKKVDSTINIDELSFCEIGKNAKAMDVAAFFHDKYQKNDIGVLSEAGCPGIADPGSEVVTMAHNVNMQVVPLVGPSSILLALMGSGFNGQSFVFHGYLPVQQHERTRSLKFLEGQVSKNRQTQVFIETPFRNIKLFEALINVLHEKTRLCIACNLTGDDEFIETKTIKEWRKKLPSIHKQPALFLIG